MTQAKKSVVHILYVAGDCEGRTSVVSCAFTDIAAAQAAAKKSYGGCGDVRTVTLYDGNPTEEDYARWHNERQAQLDEAKKLEQRAKELRAKASP